MNDLFTWANEAPRARSKDPWTSHAAAGSAAALAAAHFGKIAEALADGAATIYQLSTRTGLTHVQIARRLPEMEKIGAAEPTGSTAPGPSGRQCRLWRRC